MSISHLVSTLSQKGATPLSIASEKGHTATVDLLLRNGADPNKSRKVSEAMLLETHCT